MTHREDSPIRYLANLTRRIGADSTVLASADGLLIAGAGASAETLEELAVHAPSQRPAPAERPKRMQTRRVELDGERIYLAAMGASIPAEAVEDLTELLGRK